MELTVGAKRTKCTRKLRMATSTEPCFEVWRVLFLQEQILFHLAVEYIHSHRFKIGPGCAAMSQEAAEELLDPRQCASMKQTLRNAGRGHLQPFHRA